MTTTIYEFVYIKKSKV